MAGEEDAAAHHEEMEESGNSGKDADREHGSEGNAGSGDAMRKPVDELGQRGNAERHDRIAEPA